MHWYQHSTDSHDDPDISDAMDEFGDAGYSVFFILLEIYGREFNKTSEDWLTLSRRFLARKLRKSWTKVEQILNFYSERQRVFYKVDKNKVSFTIPQFVDMASNWVKRQKHKTTEVLQSKDSVPTAIEENRIEENRIEENRIEENITTLSSANSTTHIPYQEIITDLNRQAGTKFKHTTKKTQLLIKARFNENFTIADFLLVNAKKCHQWLGDPKMMGFLRPLTLYGTNFESYLNENIDTGLGKTFYKNVKSAQIAKELIERNIDNG